MTPRIVGMLLLAMALCSAEDTIHFEVAQFQASDHSLSAVVVRKTNLKRLKLFTVSGPFQMLSLPFKREALVVSWRLLPGQPPQTGTATAIKLEIEDTVSGLISANPATPSLSLLTESASGSLENCQLHYHRIDLPGGPITHDPFSVLQGETARFSENHHHLVTGGIYLHPQAATADVRACTTGKSLLNENQRQGLSKALTEVETLDILTVTDDARFVVWQKSHISRAVVVWMDLTTGTTGEVGSEGAGDITSTQSIGGSLFFVRTAVSPGLGESGRIDVLRQSGEIAKTMTIDPPVYVQYAWDAVAGMLYVCGPYRTGSAVGGAIPELTDITVRSLELRSGNTVSVTLPVPRWP
jgi:hypothetical protein